MAVYLSQERRSSASSGARPLGEERHPSLLAGSLGEATRYRRPSRNTTGWFGDRRLTGDSRAFGSFRHRKSLVDVVEEAVPSALRRLSDPRYNFVNEHTAAAFRLLHTVHTERQTLPRWRMCLHRLVTENKWFDRVTLGLITLNCIFLAAEDPTDKCSSGILNRVVVTSEYFFAACFTLEMAIRIAALGLYKQSFAYLRDPWNVLDAVIVISGLATIAVSLASSGDCSSGAGISGLRAFRLLRPLRAVTHLAEVRLIVASLLHSLPKLADVLLLFFFFIFVVGIIAVQLWKGKLNERCQADESAVEYSARRPMLPADEDRVCGTGFQCPWGYACVPTLNPNKGRTSFDNILWTFLTLFVAVTMEGWTDVMYFVQDSTSWWYCLYFVVLILFGSFFVMNLVLVMIGVAYFDVEQQERARREQGAPECVDYASSNREKDLGLGIEHLVGLDTVTHHEHLSVADSRRDGGEACTPDGSDAGPWGSREARGTSYHASQGALQSEVASSWRRGTAAPSPFQGGTPRQRLRGAARELVTHRYFVWGITLTIVLNTLSMAVEHHGQPAGMTQAAEILNYIFTGIFAFESCIKLYAFSRAEFTRDRFNVFDAVIALIALIDIIVLQQQTGQETGVSVLRSFRLMRMFKLAKQFPTLWATALTILRSVEGVSVITLLLLLVIFIYALLGMQFFGGEFCGLEDADSYVYDSRDFCVNLPRSNFDNLGWAIISVFQVITGEDWNVVLYNGMCAGTNSTSCAGGSTAKNFFALYFVTLFIFGNYVMLNLFIAVLISNFSTSQALSANVAEWVAEEVYQWLDTVCMPGENDPAGFDHLKRHFDPECNRVLTRPVDGAVLLSLGEEQLDTLLQIDSSTDRERLWPCVCALKAAHRDWENARATGCVDRLKARLREIDSALQRTPPEGMREARVDSPADGHRESAPQLLEPASPRRGGIPMLLRVLAQPLPAEERVRAAAQAALSNPAAEAITRPPLERWGWRDDPPGFAGQPPDYGLLRAELVAALGSSRGADPVARGLDGFMATSRGELLESAAGTPARTPGEGPAGEQLPESPRLCLLLPLPPDEPYNVALGCLPSTHWTRVWLRAVVMHPAFEAAVILLILLSTAALAMNDPRAAPDERLPQALEAIDFSLTIAFDAEAALKIVAHGFLLAPESYLRRDPWNRLDFVIVIVSNVALGFRSSGDSGTQNLGILRMMRTLRPLRFINRFPGLKLVVTSLIRAIPPLANIFLVTSLVFVIFAIMGVQFFSGTFARCSLESWGDLTNVSSQRDCVSPARWETATHNYDNLYQALVALFQISTLEGWVTQMHLGMDAVPVAIGEPASAPRKNNQPWMAIYFVVFIVVGCFFVVNLFIGVLIEQYNGAKRASDRDENLGLTEDQRLWLQAHELILSTIKPVLHFGDMPPWRLQLREWVTGSDLVDNFFTACIICNVVIMATEHEGQGPSWDRVLDISNNAFIVLFGVEFFVKWLALGCRGYMQDHWNRFDFSILVVSALGAMMQYVARGTPLIGVFRVLRLARLTRVIRTATGVRALLRTLWLSLPGLANVAGLLLLLFFLYAVVGVVQFGRVRRGECLTDRANFDDFGNALLLLFRMSTGEAWQCIMFDCEVQEPYCSSQLGDCGDVAIARVYFISFIALTFHVLLQVFIAIILSDYENVASEMAADVNQDDITHFIEQWNRRDVLGTQMLPVQELPLLLKALESCPGPPLGLPGEEDAFLLVHRKDALQAVGDACTDYGGFAHFQEVLFALVERELQKSWDPELGMDIPDRNAWSLRLEDVQRRWRLLGYRSPEKSPFPRPVSLALAALKIQAAWRAMKGREAAQLKADTLGRKLTWIGQGYSPIASPLVEQQALRGSSRVSAATQPTATGSRSSCRGSGPPSSGAAAAAAGTPTPPPRDQSVLRRSSGHGSGAQLSGAGTEPASEEQPSPPACPVSPPPAPPPLPPPPRVALALAGLGQPPTASESPRAGLLEGTPPSERADGGGAPHPYAPQPDATGPDDSGDFNTSSDGLCPPKPLPSCGGRFAIENSGAGRGISITTSHLSGPSNITIHNINIHNINIGAGGAAGDGGVSGLPPELVAQLQRQAAAAAAGAAPGGGRGTPAEGSEAAPEEAPEEGGPSGEPAAADQLRGSLSELHGERSHNDIELGTPVSQPPAPPFPAPE